MAEVVLTDAILQGVEALRDRSDAYDRDELVVRAVLTAALDEVDLVQLLAEARRPHLWNGRFEAGLRKMPRLFTTEENVQASLQKKRAEALEWAKVEADALRVEILGEADRG